jgi:hypothetical protein
MLDQPDNDWCHERLDEHVGKLIVLKWTHLLSVHSEQIAERVDL